MRALVLFTVTLLSGCFTEGNEASSSTTDNLCLGLGKECGEIEHEGETYDCGTCAEGEFCGISGIENTCCIPTSCDESDAQCGTITDGCGNALDCGSCEDGMTCGGLAANQCGAGSSSDGNGASGCSAQSCAELGAECGMLNDGCSSIVDCGGCDGEQTCGGSGTPFQCGVAGMSVQSDGLATQCLTFPVTATNFVRRSVKVALGDAAPDFTLKDIDGNEHTLSTLLEEKPVMMQTGSYTCPAYENRRGETEQLAAQYGDQVHFVVIYTPEAHPATGLSPYTGQRNFNPTWSLYDEPLSYQERVDHAAAITDIPSQLLLVDAFGEADTNPVWCSYATAPNAAILINRQGIIEAVNDWYDAPAMATAIEIMLAN